MNGMTVTQYEKDEWSRMASDAYSKDRNDVGHRFSMAASLRNGERMASDRFHSLMTEYRSWLIEGFVD